MSDKLVKVDSSIVSAHSFAERLAKEFAAPSTKNAPAVVRQKPTGKPLYFPVGEHIATLFQVRTEIGFRKHFVVFDFDVTESTTMPVLGLARLIFDVDSLAGLSSVRRHLEAVGLVDTFLTRGGDGIVTCNKRVAVSCVEKLTGTGFKIMFPTIRMLDDNA